MEETEHGIQICLKDFERGHTCVKVELRLACVVLEEDLAQIPKGLEGGHGELGKEELGIRRVAVEDLALLKVDAQNLGQPLFAVAE